MTTSPAVRPSIRPRVMTVYGTRPEAIKMAPVITALARDARFESVTVLTGQHREMLDQVNRVFGIVPDHNLDIFSPGAPLAQIAARVLERLDPVLASERPAAVIVHGDTTTALAAALAAFYRQIPVVHLEAGLRTDSLFTPFPEEANRRLITRVASLHLAPTASNRANLLAEAVPGESIALTGNTVIDALLFAAARPTPFTDPALADAAEQVEAGARRLLLVTLHRRENWGESMQAVSRGLARLARTFPDLLILLPLHPNPVVRESLLPQLEGLDNVVVTAPVPYGEFARLLALSTVILTDSGGIQEEAPSLGKPVLVLRENTERPEAVQAGTARLIGTDEARVVEEVTTLLTDDAAYARMAQAVNPYGDGHAADRCVAAVAHLLGRGERPADFAPSP
ncbi:MAG: UDP-N-acetylglucosamine 2-epimerase (non-hydrolyzing) [Promicromonosporaceae bacterium]|nr:UDP-N-acetylglucosamine 2-epimerase (non-hydrolyzing) [Promicromonosporaceae bacterium]